MGFRCLSGCSKVSWLETCIRNGRQVNERCCLAAELPPSRSGMLGREEFKENCFLSLTLKAHWSCYSHYGFLVWCPPCLVGKRASSHSAKC